MLRLFFQSLEQNLGPAFAQASWTLYGAGFVLLIVTILAPAWRVWMESATVRVGLEQRWVMTCPRCSNLVIVAGPTCSRCQADLGIPWAVRLWASATRTDRSPWARRLRWTWHLLGVLLLIVLALWFVAATDALTPQGALHRLLLGLALIALAVFGWLSGRALGLSSRGIVNRLRDGVLAVASVGLLAGTLFLADAARASNDRSLAYFTATDGAVRFADRIIPLSAGEIGIEYLQLDHESLGYHRIVPLSFVGADRVPFPRSVVGRWCINHLRDQAEALAGYGLSVRLRTDRTRIAPGQAYEVVQRGGQVMIKRAEEAHPSAVHS
ncbi:MAG: hypothetical protein AB1411_08290 [Nitrospirota bacterium]